MKPRHRAAGSSPSTEKVLERLDAIEVYLDSSAKLQQTGTYLRDMATDEHFWSPEIFGWAGLPVAERAPTTDQFYAMIGKQALNGVLAAVQRSVQERRQLELEYVIQQPGGATRHLRSIGRWIPNRAGRGAALMGTVFDLTEYRRACGALHDVFGLLGKLDAHEPQPARDSRFVLRIEAPVCSDRFVAGSRGVDADAGPPAKRIGSAGPTARASAVADGTRYRAVRGGLSARQFTRVCDLIATRLREPLEVAELAATAGLSAAHFSRAFKRTTGKAPYQFIVEQRLECARVALASVSAGKVSGVAIQFGFFDQSHFTRHFRRKFGLTPGEFLRRGHSRA